MATKRLVFSFPPRLIDQPITYRLVKQYDLKVNILSANVTAKEQGRLVVEVSGRKKALDEGLRYIEELGVTIQPLALDIRWHEDLCIGCTACTSHCPSGALTVARPEMEVSFSHEKCIVCRLCVTVCPYKAMEIVS